MHLLNTQKKKLTLESKKAMILTLFYFLIWQSTKGTQQSESNRLSVNRDDTGMGKTPICYGRKVEGEMLYFFRLLCCNNLGFDICWESDTTFFVFFVISNLKSVFNPLTLQISLAILLTVCHRIIDDNLEKLVLDQLIIL